MDEGTRGIGAVARESGLSVSALRFYDSVGVLRPAHVDPTTGYRWYTAETDRPDPRDEGERRDQQRVVPIRPGEAGDNRGVVEPNTQFLTGVERWADGLDGLRNLVRQEVLAAQVADVVADIGSARLRVLDVGCGQGTQAVRLARAGHQVTGLDISEDLLARFAADLVDEPDEVRARVRLVCGPGEHAPDLVGGPFDFILCHGVLMYFENPQPLLAGMTATAADGAVLSVLVRNGLAPAMRDGLRGQWAQASTAFSSRDYINRLGLAARTHTPAEVDELLDPLGWRPAAWFGVRVFTDHRDGPPPPDEWAELLAAEATAGRCDPYRQVAALLHLIYRRVTG